MSWAYGIDTYGEEIGYSVPDVCHQEDCAAVVDRGLYHHCGGLDSPRFGGQKGCGGFFCGEHIYANSLCEACVGPDDWEADVWGPWVMDEDHPSWESRDRVDGVTDTEFRKRSHELDGVGSDPVKTLHNWALTLGLTWSEGFAADVVRVVQGALGQRDEGVDR